MIRWVRQGGVERSVVWRPWWLLGLVEVATHPRPWRRQASVLVLPAVRAAGGRPAIPARFLVLS